MMLGELTRAVQEAHEGSRVIRCTTASDTRASAFRLDQRALRRFAMKMQVRLVGRTPATQLIAATGLSVVIGSGAVAGPLQPAVGRRIQSCA